MGIVQLRQLAANIEATVGPYVDVSDAAEKDREVTKLSRGLAAWVLLQRVGMAPDEAAGAVTDGFGDNGIDAIWIDAEHNVIYLVQSKWATKGTGSIESGDMHKYLQGVKDFVNAEFTKFNEKVTKRRSSLENALEQLDVKIVLLVAHSGSNSISPDSSGPITNLVGDMNDPVETFSWDYYSQKELHNLLRSAASGHKPDVEATLYDWGAIEDPYKAFYGQVAAHEVASWYEDHGTRLLADNIRQFLGDSEVNNSITATLLDAPYKFWYLNNGITVLCDGFTKSAAGGTSKKAGKFKFSGVSVVNGAQTVGCLAAVKADHPDQVADARVTIRFISLEGTPEEFAQDVTRGTNTQNRVERRDFVSLDRVQDRIARDLQLSGIRYAIKSGSETPLPTEGFTVTEATIALACAHKDTDLSTQAKREVGRLWVGAEDAAADSQYRALFTEDLDAQRVWRAVRVMRAVDASITVERQAREGRANLVGVHGNRLIAHLVFADLNYSWVAGDEDHFGSVLSSIPGRTASIYDALHVAADEMFESNYLASLFKNATKCRELAVVVLDEVR